MELKIPTTFSTPFLGELQEVRPGISKTRLGIYYLGKNRNQGFITEEFSKLLDENIAYQPVVGIYSNEQSDFLGHSEDKGEARIYGLVPENPNLGWEKRVDKDGIERTYRTVDVYLYTGRLEIAKTIPGHPQSMELDPNTLKGKWELIDGEPYFVYKEGRYIGFSVLGKNVEPCFEGSHFYEKDENKNFFELLEKFSNFMENGGKVMDNEMNTTVTQETDKEVVTEPVVEEVQEPESEVTTEPGTENFPDETESEVELAGEETEPTVEVAEEPEAPETYSLTGEELEAYNTIIENFESLQNVVNKFSELNSQIENLNVKIVEFENVNNTLKSEAEKNKQDFEALSAQYQAAKEVIAEIDFKKKKELCEKYSKVVSKEDLEALEAKMDDYSVEEFEKELTYAGRESLFNPMNSAPNSYACSNTGDSHLKKLLEEAKQQNRI